MIDLGRPLLLVGAGKMGGAMLSGWLSQGLPPDQIFVQDPAPPKDTAAVITRHSIACDGDVSLPASPAVLLLAVKPQLMDMVLPQVAPKAGADTVVLSIAAGQTLNNLAAPFPAGQAIVRAMPNTPAAIGRGITAAFANSATTEMHKAQCQSLLEAVGTVLWLDEEAQLDPVTAVSGSGPAYVFLLTECLAKAGMAAGLSRELAEALALATVSGSGELMAQSDLPPSTLRENVTSPAGTTAAALDVLMAENGLQDLISRAVAAAANRSRELAD